MGKIGLFLARRNPRMEQAEMTGPMELNFRKQWLCWIVYGHNFGTQVFLSRAAAIKFIEEKGAVATEVFPRMTALNEPDSCGACGELLDNKKCCKNKQCTWSVKPQ